MLQSTMMSLTAGITMIVVTAPLASAQQPVYRGQSPSGIVQAYGDQSNTSGAIQQTAERRLAGHLHDHVAYTPGGQYYPGINPGQYQTVRGRSPVVYPDGGTCPSGNCPAGNYSAFNDYAGYGASCPPGYGGQYPGGQCPGGCRQGCIHHNHSYSVRTPTNLTYPMQGPAGQYGQAQPAGAVVYPYYTHKGPDDFFLGMKE